MSETTDELCPTCSTNLELIPEDDEDNPHDGDAYVCPSCLKPVHVE